MNEDTGLSAQSANDVTDTLHKVVKGSEKEDNDGNLRMTFASDSPDDTNVLCKIFEVCTYHTVCCIRVGL